MSEAIPAEFQQFVQQEVASGRYRSAEEVVADGLRLLREQKLYDLRKDIAAGLAQLDRGEGIELEDEQSVRAFFDDIKLRGRQRLAAK
jgi:antitoxin ParD1/3/4